MTVNITDNRWAYEGDGSSTSFSYTNRIFAAGDLKVYLDGALQTLGYTVTGAGGPNGGSVVFDVPPANGASLVLVRQVPATQDLDMVSLGSFPAEENEKALDRLTVIAQQLENRADRTLRQPDSDPDDAAPLPARAARAGRLLAFDAGGDPVTNVPALPAGLTALDYVRVRPDATAYELRTPAQARADLGADNAANLVSGTLDPARLADGSVTMAKLPATLDFSGKTILSLALRDDQFLIMDPVDNTKQLRLDAGGIAPGVTRQWAAPDADGEIVITTASQTLSEKTLAEPTIDGDVAMTNTPDLGAPGAGIGALYFGAGTNPLSVYEEGSWTPTIAGSVTAGTQTYDIQLGRYIRIGNLVFAWFRARMSAKDAATSGNLQIAGLPFTTTNIGTLGWGYSCPLFNYSSIDLDAGGGYTQLIVNVAQNAAFGTLVAVGDNVAAIALTEAGLHANSDIGGTFIYRTG